MARENIRTRIEKIAEAGFGLSGCEKICAGRISEEILFKVSGTDRKFPGLIIFPDFSSKDKNSRINFWLGNMKNSEGKPYIHTFFRGDFSEESDFGLLTIRYGRDSADGAVIYFSPNEELEELRKKRKVKTYLTREIFKESSRSTLDELYINIY